MTQFFRNRKETSDLAFFLFVFLALKIALFLPAYLTDSSRVFMGDSYLYKNSAETLLELGRFSQSVEMPDAPEIVLTPGYPLFLATTYSFFGIHNLPVILIQILLSAGTLVLTYALARKFWNQKIALVACFLLAFDPASLANSFLLLTETLFTFLLLLATYASISLLQNKKEEKMWALLLGASLALATLVRPIAYYLIFPLLAGFLITMLFARLPWKKILITLALIATPWIILVGGWHIRNFSITKSFTFAYIQGINLFDYKAPDIIARRDGITYDTARQKLHASLPAMTGWSQAQTLNFYAKEGFSIIKRYPLLFLEDQAYGIAKMMLLPHVSALLRFFDIPYESESYIMLDMFKLPINEYVHKWVHGHPLQFTLFLIGEMYLLALYSSIIVAAWKIFTSKRAKKLAYIWIVGLLCYFLLFSEASPRFRVPMMPYLAMFGGAGIYYIYKSRTFPIQSIELQDSGENSLL